MSEPAQPDIRLRVLNETELRQAYPDSVDSFTQLKEGSPNLAGTFYIAAVTGNELAGFVQMHTSPYNNEVIDFVEVQPDWRQKGISKILREAAFGYANEHSGAIMLTYPTEMGKICLLKQNSALAKKYPKLYIVHEQFC